MKKLIIRIKRLFNYIVMGGVWKDTRDRFSVRLAKTINLSINAFLDRDLQRNSMSLTYSTVLAIVPAFALLFAIGRGFGFQKTLESSLYTYFPSQSTAITTALGFVDSYLNEASQSVFVGAGIVVLLWTLISLLSNIETTFNQIWDIRKDRSFYRKVTDYIAICLMIPILMVCSSGISIFMSTTIADKLHLAFLTPLLNIIFEALPLVLVWAAFALSFFLIPNTKVNFKYAAVAGVACAITFQILQLLFLNGQIYVSKYNAIYGSFAFLPLLLIWLQLSWLILLCGCVLTYSLQNVYSYNFLGDVATVSDTFMRKLTLILMSVILNRFANRQHPMTRNQLSKHYDIPIRLVNRICEKLHTAGLIYYVFDRPDTVAIAPSIDPDDLSVADLFRKVDGVGQSDFIPGFEERYAGALGRISTLINSAYASDNDTLVKDIISGQNPKGSSIPEDSAPDQFAKAGEKD